MADELMAKPFFNLSKIALTTVPEAPADKQKTDDKVCFPPGESPFSPFANQSGCPVALPTKQSVLERLLKPDEMCTSIALMHPKLKTPGEALNYIDRYFDRENPLKFLGENAIVPLNLDLRYFLTPKSNTPSLMFLNVAYAGTSFSGDVNFLRLPFKYNVENETYRLGLGYQIYALPKESNFNLSVRARLDAYYTDMEATGKNIAFTEKFSDSGPGLGGAIGFTVERKLNTKNCEWLPRDVWLFAGTEYTGAVIADYARLNGVNAFFGVRINLRN